MPQLKNDRLLKAIWREHVDVTPVWMMRQAGRYLPEYRAVRKRAGSFLALCKTPELACEVTLQPLRRFPLDAAIIFSDILTIPDAMGLGLEFAEEKGPYFTHPIQKATDIHRLSAPDPDLSLHYVLSAIRLVQHELAGKVPLIGFCGSPFTLAAYMVEGKSTPHFPLISRMVKEEPHLLHNLLEILAKAVEGHLNAQMRAGVQVVMIFDTWGGILDTLNYENFSLYYIKAVINNLARDYNCSDRDKKIPVILFTKGGKGWLSQMANSGCDCLSIDWGVTLREAREKVGGKVSLQGNMNPADLLLSPEKIRASVAGVLASYGYGKGHVFNLGHGVSPDVPVESVSVMVDAVHELSEGYHRREKEE